MAPRSVAICDHCFGWDRGNNAAMINCNLQPVGLGLGTYERRAKAKRSTGIFIKEERQAMTGSQ
jgi:hypothetical protein